eukprot:Platyproteum_vivax@DN12096_c0_g1_i2.p1
MDDSLESHQENDRAFLLTKVANALSEHDSKNNGLVSANALSSVFDNLGLKIGSGDVEFLMDFIHVIDNAHVSVKDLYVAAKSGGKVSQKEKDNTPQIQTKEFGSGLGNSQLGSSVFGSNPTEFHEKLKQNLPELRRCFVGWDKGLLTTEGLKNCISSFGLEISPELERLLDSNNESRMLPFGKFLQAMAMNDVCSNRKARVPIENQSQYDSYVSVDGNTSQRSSIVAPRTEDYPDKLRNTICDYLEGKSPKIVFHSELAKLNVPFTPELEALVRSHEADNGGHYKDFVRAATISFLKQATSASHPALIDADQRAAGIKNKEDKGGVAKSLVLNEVHDPSPSKFVPPRPSEDSLGGDGFSNIGGTYRKNTTHAKAEQRQGDRHRRHIQGQADKNTSDLLRWDTTAQPDVHGGKGGGTRAPQSNNNILTWDQDASSPTDQPHSSKKQIHRTRI